MCNFQTTFLIKLVILKIKIEWILSSRLLNNTEQRQAKVDHFDILLNTKLFDVAFNKTTNLNLIS